MTEPTLESLNEAAYLTGLSTWKKAQENCGNLSLDAIRAHALTLDQLHGRNEVSEAEEFWAALSDSCGLSHEARLIRDGEFNDEDRKAIALIEAKFAELRAPKEPAWIEWHGGECPVAPGTDCEVKFRNGYTSRDDAPEDWAWNRQLECRAYEIIAYRVLT